MHPLVFITLTVLVLYYIHLLYQGTNDESNNRLTVAIANGGASLMAPLLALTIGLVIVFGFAPAPFAGNEIAAMFIILAAAQVGITAIYILLFASSVNQQTESQS